MIKIGLFGFIFLFNGRVVTPICGVGSYLNLDSADSLSHGLSIPIPSPPADLSCINWYERERTERRKNKRAERRKERKKGMSAEAFRVPSISRPRRRSLRPASQQPAIAIVFNCRQLQR
eukprot:TRINITY_DN23523_c1_g1_i2.p1 TRINITY_DN23523_c1_g1~~TRINITY_DN23523_c1_g1_i2.p1  ORF type:complete len:119 (-),score=11.75 TRINITY_DN23523_c1_g1_i2:536-892(-)